MTALPPTMTAMTVRQPGPPDALQPEVRPMPQPGAGEILVRIAAAGVNRPDVLQRKGGYPPPPGASDIPGLEFSGEVAALGPDASRYRIGDKVCALVAGGGYAEYAVVHQDNALPIPAGLSMTEAGALPETYFTVWTNLFERGALKPGESFMVHGGTSGIGVTAIALAKAFGATVVATAGSDEKAAACHSLGADLAINYRTQDFAAEVKSFTKGRGVDVILDMVGGDYIQRNIDSAAVEGRIVQIAFQQGSKATVDFIKIMLKRITLTGSTLRIRTVEQKAAIAGALHEKVWPLIAEGRCKPPVFATFPLREAAKAHALMETSNHIGKIVLTV
ncbi:MAG: hypothetical protein BGP06_06385 [Rhizobiales bacterium 65-9]|nr:NAD(P)H-quinone oxidoreductase [Hyphomicrobiales bacterium]OJY35471.1 MAG: hypothetical protein BGP06_06385 [Rhizobiales bacterium 65-9]